MNKFLFELGTEEIPADMIAAALDQMAAALEQSLRSNQVNWERIRRYSSPRRLTLLAEGLPDRQPDREEVFLGPPQSVAFDGSGDATPAASGFARKMGIEVGELEVVETDKGAYVACRRVMEGKALPELLKESLPQILTAVSWPKNMVWRESRFRFIRPLRWFVALWNSGVVDFEFEGVRSGRVTRGHRFLGKAEVPLARPDEYVSVLRENYVMVDLEERRRKIEQGLEQCVSNGLEVLPDPKLAELVTYLNEYPSVLVGVFDPAFLEIPQEVLITVMRVHQKYFAVVDREGRLQPKFVTVLNTRGDESGEIRRGHERVLKARLEDAAFFWRSDQKKPLRDRLKALENVVFQKQLGSYLAKTERIRNLCRGLGGDAELDEAATLCKTDLTTEMVFEMTELQGVMGGLYAQREGRPEAVWKAVYEHYRPTSLDDELPATRNGALLSIADKMDTLVGCLGIGVAPTGSSDPFALRRQALGVVRILLEHRLDFALDRLVDLALANFETDRPSQEVRSEAIDFLERRVRYIFQEKGISYDVLNAVAAVGLGRVADSWDRAQALSEIKSQEDFEALAVAFKRIRNILENQDLDSVEPQRELFEESGESDFYNALADVKPVMEEALERSDYLAALKKIAGLRRVVDRFFDDVLVLTDDERLRTNRLRLLDEASRLFLRIADISEIVKKD